MYTSQVTIYERNGWRLVSLGRGAAYTLHDDKNKVSCIFQGGDAEEFRKYTMDEGGWLVDNCEERFNDYSDVMQPDAQEGA